MNHHRLRHRMCLRSLRRRHFVSTFLGCVVSALLICAAYHSAMRKTAPGHRPAGGSPKPPASDAAQRTFALAPASADGASPASPPLPRGGLPAKPEVSGGGSSLANVVKAGVPSTPSRQPPAAPVPASQSKGAETPGPYVEGAQKAKLAVLKPDVLPPAEPRPQRAGVLLIGDSMMKVGVATALKSKLIEKGWSPVDVAAKSATGLARPDVYDWPKTAREWVAAKRHRTIIVHIGANDCQQIAENAQNLRFGTPAWEAAYGKRLAQFVSVLCEDDRQVFWLGLPPMRERGFDQRIKRLDELTRKSFVAHACVTYVPASDAIAPKGRFVQKAKIGRNLRDVRASDGIHYTAHGGALIAQYLADLVDAP